MKCHIIFESSGEWEEYREYVNSVYLDKDKAFKELNRLKEEQKISEKCDNCYGVQHFYDSSDLKNRGYDKNSINDYFKEIAEEYCDRAKIYIDKEYNSVRCDNRISSYEQYDYRIEPMEIIE